MQGLQAKIVGFWDCDARLALIGFGGARVVIMGDVWYNVEKDAVVAQLAEQLIRNEQVAGSIPVNGSIFCGLYFVGGVGLGFVMGTVD